MIRAILFDLDNTLIDRDGAFARWLADFMERHPSAFRMEARAADTAAIMAFDDHGYRERDDFCAYLAGRFPALGLDRAAIWEDYRDRLPPLVERNPVAERVLEAVAPHHGLALLTNGSGKGQRARLAKAGLAHFFGPRVFVSEEIGQPKPDPLMFVRALAALGARPAETLMVGDDPRRDIAGAAALGIATCWIAMGRAAVPPGVPTPTFTIGSVGDLPALLA